MAPRARALLRDFAQEPCGESLPLRRASLVPAGKSGEFPRTLTNEADGRTTIVYPMGQSASHALVLRAILVHLPECLSAGRKERQSGAGAHAPLAAHATNSCAAAWELLAVRSRLACSAPAEPLRHPCAFRSILCAGEWLTPCGFSSGECHKDFLLTRAAGNTNLTRLVGPARKSHFTGWESASGGSLA